MYVFVCVCVMASVQKYTSVSHSIGFLSYEVRCSIRVHDSNDGDDEGNNSHGNNVIIKTFNYKDEDD